MSLTLTPEEYENRKNFLDKLKNLSKTEHEHIFKLLKENSANFSENSNGVFFDISTVSNELYAKLEAYMSFCTEVRKEQELREENERKAQEMLR